MKNVYAILAFVLVAVIVAGCASAPESVGTDTKDDVKSAKETKATAQPKKCDEAIGYQVLIDALPNEVNGYEGEEPEGNMLTFANPEDPGQVWKYSTASVRLVKEDKDIQVTVTDTCYIQFLSMAWAGFYEMDGTDGYLKKTTIDGFPGWHEFRKSPNTYSYIILVKDRVIVSVEGGTDVADSDVTAAAKAVKYSAISAAAK